MKRKAIYCAGIYILMIQMFLGAVLPCHAAGTGAEIFSAEEGKPVVTSVSISPGSVVVSKDSTCAFTASVSGENNYSRDVAWSVSGQTSQNTFIDGNGILNVASDEGASSLIVKAVSRQDSNFSATALASVQASTYYIELQASPENGGSVFGSGEVKEGGYAVIFAVPSEGFVFEGWRLDGSRVSADEKYVADNIRGDATYVAEFKAVDCRITVNVNDRSFGTATESKTVRYGENITLEAAPKDGYQFEGWTENGNTVSRDSRMQVDHITGDRTFTAVFKKKEIKNYTITASAPSAGGTVTPEGKTTVTEGSGVLYTITPKDGFAIRTVYVDGKEIGKTSSFNFSDVRGDHTISADFVEAPGQNNSNGNKTPEKAEAKDDPEKKPDQAQAKDDPEKEPEKTQAKDSPEKAQTAGQEGKDAGRGEPEESAQGKAEKSAGTLAKLGLSADEARRLIEENRDGELLAGAQDAGDLQLIVQNDFMDAAENSGAACLEKVPGQLLTGEEKLKMLQGSLPVTIELSVKDTEGKVSQEAKEVFEERKLPGMEIGRHFEISLKETKGEETKDVSKLSEKLEVVIRVPEPLKAENRKFYILRLHTKEDGSQEFAQLPDEDGSPDTITFSTDQFSPCAIAYIDWEEEDAEDSQEVQSAADDKSMTGVVVAIAVALGIGVTVLLVWDIAVRRHK